jgi:tRNA(fMet)-specific endonuclease VapC
VEPAFLGLILDSTVVIAGERRGHTVRQILKSFQTGYGEIEVGLSVVTVVELTHGIQRAATEERRQRRQAFVDELIRDVPVHPVTIETAKLAGRIEGDRAAQGVTIAFEDLLIAATALQLGFGVATGNVRHFQVGPASPSCKRNDQSSTGDPLRKSRDRLGVPHAKPVARRSRCRCLVSGPAERATLSIPRVGKKYNEDR